jgi:integrating conjugative element protein (TIGR03761 family)
MATTRKNSTQGKTAPVFPVSSNSPFQDGYDIEGERVALKDMIEADDLDDRDPRYARYVELEKREALLKTMQSDFKARDGAEPDVPYREASNVKALGKLADEGEDSMLLHTREASRLFVGRAVQPGQTGYGQSGGKKVGAALRAIWYLSGNDNPYADYSLIEAHSGILDIKRSLESEIEAMDSRLEKMRQRGLSYSIVAAVPPAKVELGFKSPYGYAVVDLISTFDYYVRMVKTLVRKDMMSDKDGYSAIYAFTHKVRSVFERVIWFQRYLLKEDLRALSRVDWLPTAPDDAKKRVAAAVGVFGALPRDVFNGTVAPRHSRRTLDVSAEELRLLNAMPLAGDDNEISAAAAEALV